MATQASVFIATSLDGYIARSDGSLDWLQTANATVPPGEDCGYQAFMEAVDVIVLGRHTFEQVLSFDEWPYTTKSVVVLSRSGITIPDALRSTVSISSERPSDLYGRLAAQGAQHLYIDGGLTIQSFLQAELIDDLTITIIPILLGSGKSLFGPLKDDIQLKHLATRVYKFGFIQSQYRVIKSAITPAPSTVRL